MRKFAAVLLLLPLIGLCDERILDFHSDIVVMQNGELEVTETIRVRAETREIVHGIYRDYPTRYKDKLGNTVKVRYEPLAVLLNGQPEPYHTEVQRNGVRTYFGSENKVVGYGENTYQYRYRAGRMLGFFDTHDELFWNVTGVGWGFPIDHASASVRLRFAADPNDIDILAFTGPAGARGEDYEASVDNDGTVNFSTTAGLSPYAGLSIVVMWPKGFVDEPTTGERFTWLLSDNVNLLVAFGGLLALFAWYIPMWQRHGKDPEPGVTFTRYKPPQGFSPASLRYIEKMHYDNTVMTAAVVNLAVKGYLTITDVGGEHTLRKTDPGPRPAKLAAGERQLYEGLFSKGVEIVLDNKNHKVLGGARKAHQQSLRRDYANRYFMTNGKLSIPGALIALVASVVAVNIGSGATFMVIASIVAMIIVVVTFAYLMMRPTRLGRKVLDEMAGFREYLEIVEKDELNLRNPPEKTPELFEKYLPFALAIGVEQRWSERFASVLATVRGDDGGGYHPAWYNGNWNNQSLAVTTNSLTSDLGSAISSSVSPPGSSSGSGGSSGGGGGGGGGGGW